MKKKKNEIKITKIRIDVRLLLLILVIAFIANFYLRKTFFQQFKFVEYTNESLCPILYTKIICSNNIPTITFENNENVSYTNISILVPWKKGINVYKIRDPLPAYSMRTVSLNYSSCSDVKNGSKKIRIRWCCQKKCYETPLNSPVSINYMLSQFQSIKKCEGLPTVRKLFCYEDVAEITNNITICYMIKDNDISSLCFAQLTLNVSKCYKIKDEKLREACITSVKTKIKWRRK